MGKIKFFLIATAAVLMMSACQSQKTAVVSDAVNTESIRIVTSAAYPLKIGGFTYGFVLQAEKVIGEEPITWSLTVESPHMMGCGQPLLIKTADYQQFYLVSTHEGRLRSEQFNETKAYRSQYVLGDNLLNTLTGENIRRIKIKSPEGFRESDLSVTELTQMRAFFQSARKEMEKRLGKSGMSLYLRDI